MLRSALFVSSGLLICANSLVLWLMRPNPQAPASVVDWFTTLSLSAALFALAFALPVLGRLAGTSAPYRASLLAAAGATGAGISNLLEVAFEVTWADLPFVFSIGLATVGMVILSIALIFGTSGTRRLLVLVPAAYVVDLLLLHASGGGLLVLAAWLVATALSLGLVASPQEPVEQA